MIFDHLSVEIVPEVLPRSKAVEMRVCLEVGIRSALGLCKMKKKKRCERKGRSR